MNTQIKDQLYKQAMAAIYEGYVTIISYNRGNVDYIQGQTFKNGNLENR